MGRALGLMFQEFDLQCDTGCHLSDNLCHAIQGAMNNKFELKACDLSSETNLLHRKITIRLLCRAGGLAILLMAASGCQFLTYSSPLGEHFSRCSFGARTSLSSLVVESTTNGVRRVELRGYTNDSTSALGAVTEAAVKAAIQGAR